MKGQIEPLEWVLGILVVFAFIVMTHGILWEYTLQPTTPPLQFECGEFEDMNVTRTRRTQLKFGWDCNNVTSGFTEFRKKYEGDNRTKIIEMEHETLEKYEFFRFVNNTVIQECSYIAKFRVKENITKKTCTNNLSIAYCDSSPEECNERYGLMWDDNKCWKRVTDDTCNGWDVTNNRCAEFRYDNYECFQCVEWEENTQPIHIYSNMGCEPPSEECELLDIYDVENEHSELGKIMCLYECVSGKGDCTRSELRCHGSVEECEDKYK